MQKVGQAQLRQVEFFSLLKLLNYKTLLQINNHEYGSIKEFNVLNLKALIQLKKRNDLI
jgi:hypothetical protein